MLHLKSFKVAMLKSPWRRGRVGRWNIWDVLEESCLFLIPIFSSVGTFPLFFIPVPNFNVRLPAASIPDQAVSVRIMWSCYGNLGTMLIISNYSKHNVEKKKKKGCICSHSVCVN